MRSARKRNTSQPELPEVTGGYVRFWYRCKRCRTTQFRDGTPGGLDNPVMWCRKCGSQKEYLETIDEPKKYSKGKKMSDAATQGAQMEKEGQEAMRRLETWNEDINRRLGGGLKMGKTTFVGARPTQGKSRFVARLASEALNNGFGVLQIGMTPPSLLLPPNHALKHGHLNIPEISKPDLVKALVRTFSETYKQAPHLIIFDEVYLGSRSQDGKAQCMEDVNKSAISLLDEIAAEHRCAVILTRNLNREHRTEEDEKLFHDSAMCFGVRIEYRIEPAVDDGHDRILVKRKYA